MSDAKVKELAKQVDENKEGITPDQLKALLEADPGILAQVEPIQQAAVEPAPAPAPSPPVATPGTPGPTPGQPNVLDIIPEKFRAEDVPTSLRNITKSYADLEAELRREKDEKANLDKLVKSFIEREPSYSPTQPQAAPQTDSAEVDDSTFFEHPAEATKRIAAKMAAAQIMAYHAAQERQKYVDDFKSKNPDFEIYRPDIVEVLRARPDLDRSERNLPLVYELGKQRYNARMSAMRKELGLETQVQQPQTTSPVDVDALVKAAYAKAREDITADILKRQAATGIQGSTPAVSPEVRVQPRVTEQPLSDDDKIIQAMINSGPKKLTLGE